MSTLIAGGLCKPSAPPPSKPRRRPTSTAAISTSILETARRRRPPPLRRLAAGSNVNGGRDVERVVASASPANGDGGGDRDIDRILRSLDVAPSPPKPVAPSPLSPPPASRTKGDGNFFLGPPQGRGTYLLVLANVAVFAVASLAGRGLGGGRLASLASSLALHHARPRWWQLVTCSFLHLDLSHLAGNLFSLLVFGRDIEATEGSAASVWLYYVITAFCASLASLIFGPSNSVSLGASGAVFGLFAVSVASKVSLNLRSLVECGVLASFVVPQVLREAKLQALGGSTTGSGAMVGHVAHLGGAAAGVLVVLLLSRLPQA